MISLKKQLGISSTSYSHSKLFPIYGSGQGSGKSPGLWCTISSVLFDVYKQQACGVSFYSPDQTNAVKLYMIGFADDTSSSTNDFLLPEPSPLPHYAKLATHDAQQWNDTLQLSCSVLEDSKCSYHFMYYEFTRNGQPVLKGGTFEPAISIRFDNTTTPTPLKQLSAYTSHKTLGVYKNPDSNTTAAFQVLKEKNATHTKTASCSPLTHTDAWAYYNAIYLPSIVYPFPSGSLHSNQCQHLQKQVKQAILPKCSYNCNTPNTIIYGPSEYGGIEMRSHQTEQGIAQTYSLMMSLRAEGVPRKLALITLAWAQLLAGTQQPVLSNVTNALPHLTPMKWIHSIRDFLHTISRWIEDENLPAIPLQCKHDWFLIDIALDLYSKPSELQHLNMCPLHLHVTPLSDITMADGKFIQSKVM